MTKISKTDPRYDILRTIPQKQFYGINANKCGFPIEKYYEENQDKPVRYSVSVNLNNKSNFYMFNIQYYETLKEDKERYNFYDYNCMAANISDAIIDGEQRMYNQSHYVFDTNWNVMRNYSLL